MAAGKPRMSRSRPAKVSRSQGVQAQLKDILMHLEQAQSAVVVAIVALRQQSCELDEDIAAVLQRNVAQPLQDQIEKLEAAVQQLSRPERKP
jgi:tRNA A37 N6-isopentenylltransferase MiaA